jgi:hypothetical protein
MCLAGIGSPHQAPILARDLRFQRLDFEPLRSTENLAQELVPPVTALTESYEIFELLQRSIGWKLLGPLHARAR